MRTFLLIPLLAFCFSQTATGQENPSPDKSLSPYFFVKGTESDADRFPLKATSASVDITGVIAHVKVTQVYANEGRRPLEAIYIFPGSTRAAVHGMRMTIGDRTITARIEERQEARRQYEAARDAGRTASLLEQQRPNVFQMNVANILPRDEVKVELTYTELLVPERAVYEFVFPTVVGPRYARSSEGDAPGAAAWTRNPYLRNGTASPAKFQFDARIASGIPLKEVMSPSHKVTVTFAATDRATVGLAADEQNAGNRDVVLRYRLAGDRIETGVLLSEGPDENFFVCMVEPPRRVAPASIPPREYVFIMDVSGSMNGFPIEVSKRAVRAVLEKLRPIDYFNLIFFSGASHLLSATSLPATEANKRRGLQDIEEQYGGGGTELLPALRRAVTLPRPRADIARIVLLATDGYVNVEREAFTLIRDHLGDASVFAFGIGSAVNRHLIEGMARVGKGLPFVVLTPDAAETAALRFVDYVDSPLLTQVDAQFNGFAAYDLEPASVPDLFADRPIVLSGKFRGQPRGEIRLTGFDGAGRFERTIRVGREQAAAGHALPFLWARDRVALLSDYASLGSAEESRAEVTRLGLKYGLLTQFTSFVAVDQHVRRADGKLETVKQPLPLPAGVSDLAVGQTVVAMATAPTFRTASSAPVAESRSVVARTDSLSIGDPAKAGGVAGGFGSADRLSAIRVTLVENRLTRRFGPDVLQAAANASVPAIRSSLSGSTAAGAPLPMKLKVTFDGSRRPVRVELLEAGRWKQHLSLAGAGRDAVLRAFGALPSSTSGYLVITIDYR